MQINSLTLSHLVDEVNKSNLKRIYTYTGDEKHDPIYYEETELFKKMIRQVGLQCEIKEISDSNFSPERWEPQTSLLHIPGAMATELENHLGSKVEQIRKFIERGGSGLFWCGASYWAAREAIYQDKIRTRQLALWKGIQIGPLLPYRGNPEGNVGFFHGAVKVHWEGTDTLKKWAPRGLDLHVLLSGGGSFIPDREEYPHKVLVTYSEQPPHLSNAGVKSHIGKGVSICMFPYWTHNAAYFEESLAGYEKHFPDHNWRQLVADIKGCELKSQICFVDMLLETQKSG